MAKSFVIDMWLARVTPDKVMPILLKVIEAAKDQYAESIKHGDGIYAVGYCVGGRFVMLLAQETEKASADEESGSVKSGPHIRAGAVAHAASVIPDDFKNIKAPLSFVCVEDDPLFPDTVRSAGEDTMADANLEHEVQVYPRVPHGKHDRRTQRQVFMILTFCYRICGRRRIRRPSHQGCPVHGI